MSILCIGLVGLVIVLWNKYNKAINLAEKACNQRDEYRKQIFDLFISAIGCDDTDSELDYDNENAYCNYIEKVLNDNYTIVCNYNMIWEEQANETKEVIREVLTKIEEEVDELVPDNEVILDLADKTVVNNGSYGFINEGNKITHERILISPIVIFDDREKRLIDYYNNAFRLRLAYDAKTARILTFLHEVGHMVDFNNRDNIDEYENNNNELYAKLSECETEEEADYAYRQVPCEAYADDFAVEMLIKYYPELAFAC